MNADYAQRAAKLRRSAGRNRRIAIAMFIVGVAFLALGVAAIVIGASPVTILNIIVGALVMVANGFWVRSPADSLDDIARRWDRLAGGAR